MDGVFSKFREIADKVTRVVMNYTAVETKVCEATNDEPWGPTGVAMQELAQYTYNYEYYAEVMSMLWKRLLHDNKNNWRRVTKCLTLLSYLVRHGSERVVTSARDHLYDMKLLETYQCLDEHGRDNGLVVRQKVKDFLSFIQNDDRVRTERKQAKAVKGKLTGISGDAYSSQRSYSDRYDGEQYYSERQDHEWRENDKDYKVGEEESHRRTQSQSEYHDDLEAEEKEEEEEGEDRNNNARRKNPVTKNETCPGERKSADRVIQKHPPTTRKRLGQLQISRNDPDDFNPRDSEPRGQDDGFGDFQGYRSEPAPDRRGTSASGDLLDFDPVLSGLMPVTSPSHLPTALQHSPGKPNFPAVIPAVQQSGLQLGQPGMVGISQPGMMGIQQPGMMGIRHSNAMGFSQPSMMGHQQLNMMGISQPYLIGVQHPGGMIGISQPNMMGVHRQPAMMGLYSTQWSSGLQQQQQQPVWMGAGAAVQGNLVQSSPQSGSLL